MGLFSGISGNVLILGMVSFLTDVSSKMIYPLLPLFVASLTAVAALLLTLLSVTREIYHA
jgi:hypothetical protein